MEIDNLALISKVRWHNRMSVEHVGTGEDRATQSRYTPAPLAAYLNLVPGPATDTTDYGTDDAVSCFDHVYLRRDKAREYGQMKIGRWDAMAELGVLAGLALYIPFNVEDKFLVGGRMVADGQDSLIRAGYWRRFHESWKRQNAIRDEIASLGSYPNMDTYWTTFVERDRKAGATLRDMISLACKSRYVTWSWRGNDTRTISPSVNGGRTPSSWWRADLNEKWVPFTLGGGDNHPANGYMLNTSLVEWSYNLWTPQDKGEDDFPLESALNRINMELGPDGVTYVGLPGRQEIGGFGYNIESMTSVPP